jgi:hypothetical protein
VWIDIPVGAGTFEEPAAFILRASQEIRLFVDCPEDGDIKLLIKFGAHILVHTASYPRKIDISIDTTVGISGFMFVNCFDT